MIRFALVCDHGHAFESWFRDGAAFDRQSGAGFIECPACGSTKVDKQLMAPSVARADRSGGRPARPAEPAGDEPMALISAEARAVRHKLAELRDMLTKDSDYVGSRFAEEARKMHFGEIEHRTIHGEASREDVRGLLEDNVPIAPLPILPDERN